MSCGRAVLLDLDGTLSDSRPGIEACFRYMLAELGHDPAMAGDLTWAVGPPIAVSIRTLLAKYGDDRVDLGLTTYRARYTDSRHIRMCGVPRHPGDAGRADRSRPVAVRRHLQAPRLRRTGRRLPWPAAAICPGSMARFPVAGWTTRRTCWPKSCASRAMARHNHDGRRSPARHPCRPGQRASLDRRALGLRRPGRIADGRGGRDCCHPRRDRQSHVAGRRWLCRAKSASARRYVLTSVGFDQPDAAAGSFRARPRAADRARCFDSRREANPAP